MFASHGNCSSSVAQPSPICSHSELEISAPKLWTETIRSVAEPRSGAMWHRYQLPEQMKP